MSLESALDEYPKELKLRDGLASTYDWYVENVA